MTLRCVPLLFNKIIDAALALAGATALVFIIYGGFKYIRSGGDPKQADGARKTITYALIGLILVLMSFFLLHVISNFTGVGCINQFGFDNCQ